MKKPPARWRDLHPGDMVIEYAGTLAALQQAADGMRPEGYRFTVEQYGDTFLVVCKESPRNLIGDRPCN